MTLFSDELTVAGVRLELLRPSSPEALITDSELLSLDRIVAEVDAVDAASVSALAGALLASERLSAACIGPNEERFLEALERITPDLARAA